MSGGYRGRGRGRGKGPGRRVWTRADAQTSSLNPDAKPFHVDSHAGGKRKREGEASAGDKLGELERQRAELERKIKEKKRKLAEEVRFKKKQEALKEAARRSKEEAERKAKLDKLKGGFAMLAEKVASDKPATQQAKEISEKAAAKPAASAKAATMEDLMRVLNSMNDYEVLQVNMVSDVSTIRKNFLSLSRTFHPDKCKLAGSRDAFQRITKAYTNLKRVHS